MLHLRLSASHAEADRIGRSLDALDGVRRIVTANSRETEELVLSADIDPGAADLVIAELERIEVGHDDYVLASGRRGRSHTRQPHEDRDAGEFAWVEVLGEARANSRPLARYLALMFVAAWSPPWA